MEMLVSIWESLPVVVQILLKITLIMAPLMILVAYYTYAERKVRFVWGQTGWVSSATV